MTDQEIFSAAYIGVMTQPGLAVRPGGGCVYFRQEENGPALMCAVGHVLGREVAARWAMNDYPDVDVDLTESIDMIPTSVLAEFGIDNYRATGLLNDLQFIHDRLAQKAKKDAHTFNNDEEQLDWFRRAYSIDMAHFARKQNFEVPQIAEGGNNAL